MKRIFDRDSGQRCPACDTVLAAADINIAEGVALCPSCGGLKRLSELRLSSRSIGEILARTPAGCSIETFGQAVRVRASIRSIGGFIAALAMTLFWNGITSVFVCLAVAGLYSNLVGPIPEWFPMFGLQDGKPKMNDGPMSLGESIGLCLFITPFVVVGTGMLIATVLQLIGRVDVFVDDLGSYVATGCGGPFRWKRRFDAHEVVDVTQAQTSWKQNSEHRPQIALVFAERKLKFGSMVAEERLEWMYAALHELLLGDGSQGGADFPRLPWLRPRR